MSSNEEGTVIDDSTRRLGGWASILVGISYLLVGVTFFMLPAAQGPGGGSAADFLTSVAESRGVFLTQGWLFAIGALLALAAVPAITSLVEDVHRGWARWAATLATVGFAVTAVNFFLGLGRIPVLADVFANAEDEMTRTAVIGDYINLTVDPQGWLGFGAVGLWVLVIGILALRGGGLPSGLGYVAIGVGVSYWLVVLGNETNTPALIAIAAGLGGIVLGPIFYIWTGLRLRAQT